MICERCHKRVATLKYTEVVRGKAVQRDICETCLGDLQGDAAGGFEMTGAPDARLPKFARWEREPQFGQSECPTCGSTLRDVVQSGRVGCGACYDTFSGPLESMLRSLHPSPAHRGKAPHLEGPREHMRLDLRSKRSLLRSALKAEDYEQAAELRDAISALETELGSTAVGQN
ncbi:MAG: hypothetical protein GY851_07145 [bacterium]|nr:hypothetical protein [bacterium]